MNHVKIDFSRSGELTDNADVGSFNGRFRDECLKISPARLPLLETEFGRVLIRSRGDWLVLINRSMAAVILLVALLVVLSRVIGRSL